MSIWSKVTVVYIFLQVAKYIPITLKLKFQCRTMQLFFTQIINALEKTEVLGSSNW